MKLLPNDTLNSKIRHVCELKPFLVYAENKYVTIDEKTLTVFLGKQCYHKTIFILFFYEM